MKRILLVILISFTAIMILKYLDVFTYAGYVTGALVGVISMMILDYKL